MATQYTSPSVGLNAATGGVLEGWPHVVQSLQDIFTTRFGTRIMREWYGSFVPNLLGRIITPNEVTPWFAAVTSAIEQWEPRYRVTRIQIVEVTHDYKRHGTTTLFAALDVKSGLVIGECMPRHRAREFLTFLRRIDRAVKKPRDIHLVLDNYATHKTPEVKAWLSRHPRFKLHFTPTSASWMNLVERFFAEITTKRIRRGSYGSVDDLEEAIYDYLLQHNAKPKPFVWTKSADDIITRERRALDALDEIRGNR